jgi:hypothetical protein
MKLYFDVLLLYFTYNRFIPMKSIAKDYENIVMTANSEEHLIFSCNLVDPASSHMLVSKIKPCKSKY